MPPFLRSTCCVGLATLSLVASTGHAPSAPVGGIWATEGYGYVLDLSADTVEAFEVTKLSCMEGFRAAAAPTPSGALAAFTMLSDPVTFIMIRDSVAGRARLHMNGAASDMLVHRIDRKPAVCDHPTANTPQSNLEVFAATWAEHYPFFAEKKTDWAAVVAANRAKVTASTTPEQLFAVLEGMIAPLMDAHTFIDAKDIKQEYHGSRKSAGTLARADRDKGYALATSYLRGPLHSFCEGRLEYGMLTPTIGYLRIRGFFGYTKDGAFETGLTALEAALDTVFADAQHWTGLVIDVRINGGGADPYGLAIASRLTGAPYVAYAKQARSDPTDASKWTPAQTSLVKPSSRPGFRGAVVELIGVQSVSAAETFSQALLDRPVPVTRVGENTQGVFSDVLVRKLPNGWRFGLPNERFVTDGKTYDGPGIAPDVRVESFTPAGIASGKDAGIERALTILGASTR